MHFDNQHMRHEDSLKLFSQDEYKTVLKEVVKEFTDNKGKIMESIYNRTEALRKVGFTRNQYVILVQNIQSNVREAEKICGIASSREGAR